MNYLRWDFSKSIVNTVRQNNKQNMKDIETFLLKNGFARIEDEFNGYTNYECKVYVDHDYFTIDFIEGIVYSDNLNIYWLIGFLTYNGLMDKNYIQ